MLSRARMLQTGVIAIMLMRLPTLPASAQGVWTPVDSKMSVARDAHTAVLWQNMVLVFGGRISPGGTTTARAELFDLAAGRFQPLPSLTASRSFFPAVLLRDGALLLPGGYRQAQSGRTVRDSERFLPASRQWERIGDMMFPRELHTATPLPNGKILITGGFSNNVILGSSELYDPTARAFFPTGGTRLTRFGHAALLLHGRVFVIGGRTYKDLSLFGTEWYDPAAGAWSDGPSLRTDRFRHTATLLRDGRILITGGYSSWQGRTLATAEIYDPATDAFHLLADAAGKPLEMSDGRMDHTASLLPDGRVLLVGGWSSVRSSTVASADIFDPQTNAFTPAAPLPVSRHEHTATLLPDGKILLIGGLRWEPNVQQTLQDAYFYTP